MTLADLSAWVRVALRWVLIVSVILITLWISWIVIVGISSTIFKPKGADTAFGVLDPPIFTKTFSSFKSAKYELDFKLPGARAKVEVFQMEKNAQSSEDQQKQVTSVFGMSSAKKTQDKGLVTWTKDSGEAVLQLNTSNNHFTFRRNYSNDKNLFKSKVSLNEKQALQKAAGIFKKLKLSLEGKNINEKDALIKYYSLSALGRKEAKPASANTVEIKYFRKVGKILSTGDASIRLLLASGGSKILEFDYYYSPLNPTGAPYPIISSSKAWEEVKAGNSFTESKAQFSYIKVTSVVPSYWESRFYQPFLQPVWVFAGKGTTKESETQFQAVVPAVSPDYLSLVEKESQP